MKRFIGFSEALETACSMVSFTGTEFLPLVRLTGRVLSSELFSKVDSPSVDASLKDGYAVRSCELKNASPENPIKLELVGQITAGLKTGSSLEPGNAFRITTGSAIPEGADAVLSEEFANQEGNHVICRNTAEKGRNILFRGTDIKKGDRVAGKGVRVAPALTGLMATAGLDGAQVYKQPRVCVIATGDEVVAPGLPLPEGKLYASNVMEICAWLTHFGILFDVAFAGDTREEIAEKIKDHKPHADAFITSGGIWGSEKDLMIHALDSLNWQGVYHRVRMGPGKAVAFGLLENKPFFCLPGGPPSNEMAFLQIALPGILNMTGVSQTPFPLITATLTADVRGTDTWTQFFHAIVEKDHNGGWQVSPLKQSSRLQSMAHKNAFIMLPEGCDYLPSGASTIVQVLEPAVFHL